MHRNKRNPQFNVESHFYVTQTDYSRFIKKYKRDQLNRIAPMYQQSLFIKLDKIIRR